MKNKAILLTFTLLYMACASATPNLIVENNSTSKIQLIFVKKGNERKATLVPHESKTLGNIDYIDELKIESYGDVWSSIGKHRTINLDKARKIAINNPGMNAVIKIENVPGYTYDTWSHKETVSQDPTKGGIMVPVETERAEETVGHELINAFPSVKYAIDYSIPIQPRHVLNLPKGYSKGDVTEAFKTLSLKWHPDKNRGNPIALIAFKFVKHAKDAAIAKLDGKPIDWNPAQYLD